MATSDVEGTRTGSVLTVSATFTNNGTQPTSSMLVEVDLEPLLGGSVQSQDPANVSPDFAFVSRSGNSGGRTYVFTKVDPQLSGAGTPGETAVLSFEVPVSPNIANVYSGTITVTPSPTPGAGTPGGGAWT